MRAVARAPANLVGGYFTRVLGLCYQALGDAALAERATEMIFRRLSYAGEIGDRAVWRTTVRVLRKYLARRLNVDPLASDAPGWQAPLLDGLAALQPDERILLLLRYHEGLDHATLADVLGIDMDRLGQEILRVRRRLIDVLGLRDALR